MSSSERLIDSRYRLWLVCASGAAAAGGLIACGVLAGVLGMWPCLWTWLLCLPFMAGSCWMLGWAPDLLVRASKRLPENGRARRGWMWGGAYLFRYLWYVLPIVIAAAGNGFALYGAFSCVAAIVGTLVIPFLGVAVNVAVFWADVRKPDAKGVIYAATGDSLTAS